MAKKFLLLVTTVILVSSFFGSHNYNYAMGKTVKIPSPTVIIPTKNDFEEQNQFIYCQQIMNGLSFMSSLPHSVSEPIEFSRTGFLLHIYNLVADGNIRLSPLPEDDIEREIGDYWKEEVKQRLNKLVELKIVTKEEINDEPITKEFVANILYRIYKPVIPYKRSIVYTDTSNEALYWAGEMGLPYYSSRSGFQIFPDSNLTHPYDYKTVLSYVYLYLPIDKDNGKYKYHQIEIKDLGELDNFLYQKNPYLYDKKNLTKQELQALEKAKLRLSEVLPHYIASIREELLKPRLGYWKRDVELNPEIKPYVEKYRRTKTDKVAEEVLELLRQKYNLFVYQESISYVKYMFELQQ
ncbi:hypothetical protein [Thermincola ferriacetica]